MSSANTEWISVSDVMTGLMMVFLFVSVVFMQQIDSEQEKVEKIALTYTNYQEELFKALSKEFADDLDRWNAEILQDNTVRFKEPNVLFAGGSSEIRSRFKTILVDFFPRYVSVLASPQFRDSISEVRIEGHTSSNWVGSKSLEERYLKNAQLSQARSFSILAFCFALPRIKPTQDWLTQVLRANGLAFAKPVRSRDGREDFERSRRVEFRVRTKTEERISEIVQTIRGRASGGK